MSAQDNLKTARGLYDAFNTRNFNQGRNLVDDNAEFNIVPFNLKLHGKEGYQQYVDIWANAFPDGFCNITNIVTTDDSAVVEFIGQGTQNGLLKTPDGEIKPTGKKVAIPFCEVFKIKNDKITSVHTYFDVLTMMTQLELTKQKATA